MGTEENVAPEVLAYEMAYGRTPFRGRTSERPSPTFSPAAWSDRRSDLTDLVERLLAKDLASQLGSRSGAEEVKAHSFFRGVHWELLAEVAGPPFLASCKNDDEEHAGSATTSRSCSNSR
ncbi:hypothetical protein Taro_042249 [Colocasia esculenta]|uniref:non-specific serine/threonine protein kinase n=1 Tax=Colocasia esculenta TaxID=4460 RepID=A0A843WP14_COLES|nr:hypothetical protein [Colocasia esculenta]